MIVGQSTTVDKPVEPVAKMDASPKRLLGRLDKAVGQYPVPLSEHPLNDQTSLC